MHFIRARLSLEASMSEGEGKTWNQNRSTAFSKQTVFVYPLAVGSDH